MSPLVLYKKKEVLKVNHHTNKILLIETRVFYFFTSTAENILPLREAFSNLGCSAN